MATFDRERREIVLRLVYDGAAHAGKTANLRALHASFTRRAQGNLYVPAETATGRTLYFDSLELRVGHLDDWPLRCQILTVPGQFAFAERRYRLLRGIDAVVLVCESTPRGVETARYARTFLSSVLAARAEGEIPVIVQANKQDLPGALTPGDIEDRLGLTSAQRVLPASALHGDGVRETFLAALSLARQAVRDKLAGVSPEALGPLPESMEDLYAEMVREADATPDAVVTAALEEALSAMAARDGRSWS